MNSAEANTVVGRLTDVIMIAALGRITFLERRMSAWKRLAKSYRTVPHALSLPEQRVLEVARILGKAYHDMESGELGRLEQMAAHASFELARDKLFKAAIMLGGMK